VAETVEVPPEDLVKRLAESLEDQQPNLTLMDQYYEGVQPLQYMVPALQEELGERITQLVINWPRLGVDAYENRLDIEGFRMPGAAKGDEEMWRIWQYNDLDEVSQQAHLEALIMSRAYVIVGVNELDPKTPIITVEHPSQVITEHDPRTRAVTAGVKVWEDLDEVRHATLYLPNSDIFFIDNGGEWVQESANPHNRGMCAVVPMVNRPRILNPFGTSELVDVIPIANAANKLATDMMISAEFHAMPRRAWFGMTEDDFTDEQGNALSVWSRVAGREWATALRKGAEADVEQFPEAELSNFHNSLKLLAQTACQVLALPPHYMQFAGSNPASADAIRSSEAQLVKRVERKQRVFGGSWERVMRLAAMVAGNGEDPELTRLETVWRDASTPTVAQVADAAVKKLQVGISTLRQAREDVGYTDTQITLMEADDAKALAADPIGAIARDLAGTGVNAASTVESA
jgi:hypothetical protein